MDSNMTINSFEDYCLRCYHFDSSTGVCSEIHENVRSYPKRFIKKCNGEFYKEDQNKMVEEVEEVEDEVPVEPELSTEGMTGGEWLGAIFCTPYGLIKYFDWKNTSPRKAKQVCTFYLIAFPISILIRILIETG